MESQARAPKAEPRREALVLAAYRLLAERGFEGLRTRDIAGAVKINVATLHYYFPTKEALVRAVVGHAFSRFRTTLVPSGRTTTLLKAHFDGLRRLGREEPELFAVMGELALRAARDETMAAIVRETDQQWHATIRKAIRKEAITAVMDLGTPGEQAAYHLIHAYCRRRIGGRASTPQGLLEPSCGESPHGRF